MGKLFLILVASLALMQGPTGSITGRVTDAENGSPISDAVVVLHGVPGSGVLSSAISNRDGIYTLAYTPGSYRVAAVADGYARQELGQPVPVTQNLNGPTIEIQSGR